MDKIKNNLKPIIIMVLLVLGLIASGVLLQRTTVFKSRASADINNALEITSGDTGQVQYQGNNTYKTDTLNIRIGIKDLQQFK